MNIRPSEPNGPAPAHQSRGLWLIGRPNPEREFMGSPGEWDPIAGEPPQMMAGRSQHGTAELPYMMSSPGHWDHTVGEPAEMMAGANRSEAAQLPYMMSSPGTWNPSEAGPRDMMA